MINARSAQRFATSGEHSVTLPDNPTSVLISAEGGPVRYAINGSASASSAGFVPAGKSRIVSADLLTSVSVYVPEGSIANCLCLGR